MLIERHIFGSFKGYTTLSRSPGVSADDCRILESLAYSFGQTYDVRFNKTLSRVPAFFTRSLRGGRRGLSRVLEGTPDDNNRPTLQVVTVIVSQQDWDARLSGDVQILLDDDRLWQWDGSAQAAAMEVSLPPASHSVPRKSVPRVLALLSEIERSVALHRGVIVSANEFTQQDVACLEMLIPPSARAEFSSAYRTLSPQLRASVNCMAPEAALQDRITFHFRPQQANLSPYAEYLNKSGFADGSIPLESIAAYSRFGMPAVETPSATHETPPAPTGIPVARPARAWPLVAVALAAVVLAVGAFVGAQLLSANQAEHLQSQVDSLRGDNAKLAGELAAVGNTCRKLQDGLENLEKSVVPAAMSAATSRPMDESKKLDGKLLRQQAARVDSIDAQAARLVKKATDDGAAGLDSTEIKWCLAEIASLDQELLEPEQTDELSGRKMQLESLLQIVETYENTGQWERKIEGVKTRDQADRTLLANEIGTQAYQAFGRLKPKLESESKPELKSPTTGQVKVRDLGELEKRLDAVCSWILNNGFAVSRPATATSQCK